MCDAILWTLAGLRSSWHRREAIARVDFALTRASENGFGSDNAHRAADRAEFDVWCAVWRAIDQANAMAGRWTHYGQSKGHSPEYGPDAVRQNLRAVCEKLVAHPWPDWNRIATGCQREACKAEYAAETLGAVRSLRATDARVVALNQSALPPAAKAPIAPPQLANGAAKSPAPRRATPDSKRELSEGRKAIIEVLEKERKRAVEANERPRPLQRKELAALCGYKAGTLGHYLSQMVRDGLVARGPKNGYLAV